MSELADGVRGICPRDLFSLRTVSDPQVSPTGRWVAYVVTEAVAATNGYRSTIWVLDLVSGESRPLLSGTQPRWSPDEDRLAYVGAASFPGFRPSAAESVVDGAAQLFIWSFEDASAEMVTDVRGGVRSPAWSPSGDSLVFLTYVNPSVGLERSSLLAFEEPDPYRRYNRDVLVTESLRWKFDGIGYLGDYYSHVARVWVKAGTLPRTKLLTVGPYEWSSPTWSPDGSQLALLGNMEPGGEGSRRSVIYLVAIEGESVSDPQPLHTFEEVRTPELAWSPDGSSLALSGHQRADLGHYGNQRLWVVEAKNGTARCLTDDFDLTLGNASVADMRGYGGPIGPSWSSDGTSLWALVSDAGTVNLWSFSADGSARMPLTSGVQVVSSFVRIPDTEEAVCLISDEMSPADLFRFEGPDRPPARLTFINEAALEGITVSRPQKFQFDSEDVRVDGWVIPALGLAEGETAPAILYAGGGPGGMRGAEFFFEYQMLAAQGYSVIYINTRGCQGYGEAFGTAILGDWGGADYVDNMAGLSAAIDTFDFIDSERIGAAGGSYGGYTVNWIIGHTDRIRAAVSDRCVFNRYSSYGTSDIMPWREFEFGGGPPWETPEDYLAQSPLRHMGKVNTPTLVVHSALDHRCPVEQGEQLYIALKRRGVPTRLVRFSDESHGLSRNGKPWHRVYRMDHYLKWFEEWL